MTTLTLRTSRCALALLGVLFVGLVSAQSYYIAFSGTPSSIACTTTDFSLGAGSSGFSFDCASAIGTNFQIIGAGNFGSIPTLSEWGLAALATLLAAASLVTLRRRRARG